MEFGKTIKLYLLDSTATGIKFGEIINQTIQSISCPRSRFVELSKYSEAKRPGVYFLFGEDDETLDIKSYIGEGENVFDRLQDHISNKAFWSEVIFFVSKDENLTKAHVKYLESRLIEMATSARRYKIDNANQSQKPALPRPDIAAMEEFLSYIKLLLGVWGHKILEETSEFAIKTESQPNNVSYFSTSFEPANVFVRNNLELSLNIAGIKAKGVQTDEGIAVESGSQAAKEATENIQTGYKRLREKLIANGTLILSTDKFIFEHPYIFKSPSSAASIIAGYNVNGKEYWKDKNGRSLNEIERQQVESIGKSS